MKINASVCWLFGSGHETKLGQDTSAGNRVHIYGKRFGSEIWRVDVSVVPTVAVKVISCRDSEVVLDIGDTSNLASGDFKAKITVDGVSSNLIKFGTIVNAASPPVITAATTSIDSTATAFTIAGGSFGATESDVRVYFSHAQVVGMAQAARAV